MKTTSKMKMDSKMKTTPKNDGGGWILFPNSVSSPNGSLVLKIGTIPGRFGLVWVGSIVIIRLSQPACRDGAWTWLILAKKLVMY